MADLQHQAMLFSQGRQRIGLGQRGRDRLFHQHMLPRPQRSTCQFEMRFGGCCHHHGVAGLEQIRETHRHRTGLFGHMGGTDGVKIIHPHQPRPLGLRYLQGVKTAEMSGSGNPDAQDRHGELLVLRGR